MEYNIENTKDDILDSEHVRRYFLKRYYDTEQQIWSYNTFQLRDLNPPENFLSVTRTSVAPDAVENAKAIFPLKKLPKVLGYTLLLASDVRKIDIEKVVLKLLSDANSTTGHAGIFTWHDSKIVEGSVENPEILELKKTLFNLAIPTYTAFSSDAFVEEEEISNPT